MAWDIRVAVDIEDVDGVRAATAGEAEVRVIKGGLGGVSSIAEQTDSDGLAYFDRCPGFLGTTECGPDVWGIKTTHLQTGKWVGGELTIHNGTYSFELLQSGG